MKNLKLMWIGMLAIVLASCFPEDDELTLGEMVPAEFTIEEIDGMSNKYLLKSSSDGGFIYKWDLGNGQVFNGNQVDTAFYSNEGTYTVQLRVVSPGGWSDASPQEVTVPQGVNVLTGGDMSDENAWEFYNSGSALTEHSFTDGKLVFTNGTGSAQTNVVMWQEVELQANANYHFSAAASGSGMTNSWMEVILLDEEPLEGDDPGGAFVGLNTWTGCGGTAFEGTIPEISCIGEGVVSVAEAGTYYLVVKVGSWDGNLGSTGLVLDDLALRGVNSPPLVEGDNILAGSDMEDAGAWTVTDMGMATTTVEFTDGVMKFTNGSETTQTNIGVWQAVDVEAGQKYRVKATVNDPGASGSWIEFYLHNTQPSDGTDYTTGRIEIGEHTSFSESGTVYYLIKVGSWDGNLSTGVTIDDAQLVEVN